MASITSILDHYIESGDYQHMSRQMVEDYVLVYDAAKHKYDPGMATAVTLSKKYTLKPDTPMKELKTIIRAAIDDCHDPDFSHGIEMALQAVYELLEQGKM